MNQIKIHPMCTLEAFLLKSPGYKLLAYINSCTSFFLTELYIGALFYYNYIIDRLRRFYPMQKVYKIPSRMARVALLMDGSVVMSRILPVGKR